MVLLHPLPPPSVWEGVDLLGLLPLRQAKAFRSLAVACAVLASRVRRGPSVEPFALVPPPAGGRDSGPHVDWTRP